MRLDHYMVECLLHPDHGYYATRDPFGRAGDFITAPEISQMFGEMLGLCLAQVWLEGLLLGAILVALVWGAGALRRPGTVFGVFLIGYGLARGFVEFFRQPDAQFQGPGNPLGYALQFGDYGLTMGQILSLPMILAGLILVLRARRA
ncbi:hypothetical protein D2T31_00800 [Sinirhodobacter populi]|uniref:Prolipoprotein diacylglyceryl transferase n=2 Tax=Paenirhodobacter populi TaxID=2306993 RepID=A0A443KJG1_9RHOB|nr:hypothetical protein D2T31_00800 [Sinirhodobacter populi]